MANDNARQIVAPPTPMKITQIAVVVRDIEAALRTYTQTLGWGPWSVFDYKPPLLHDTRVKGEPVEYRMIGAEVLMSGRIGDSIEFYYLDTAPMLKFVLESGSGHAIDLKPTYVYP